MFNKKKVNILVKLARKSLQVLRGFDFDDLLLGDGECILGKGKETLEEFLN